MPKFKKSLTPTRTQNLTRSIEQMNVGIERRAKTIQNLDSIIDLDREIASRKRELSLLNAAGMTA